MPESERAKFWKAEGFHEGASAAHGEIERLQTEVARLKRSLAHSRRVLDEISDEVGLAPEDGAGLVRAVKARDGAGGELVDIAVLLGAAPHHRPRGEVFAMVAARIGRDST